MSRSIVGGLFFLLLRWMDVTISPACVGVDVVDLLSKQQQKVQPNPSLSPHPRFEAGSFTNKEFMDTFHFVWFLTNVSGVVLAGRNTKPFYSSIE